MLLKIRRRWRVCLIMVLVVFGIRLASELADRISSVTSSSGVRFRSSDITNRYQMRHMLTTSDHVDVDLFTVDMRIDYAPYSPSLPQFVHTDDQRLFVENSDNRQYLGVPPSSALPLTGRIRVMSHGVIRPRHECSWKTSISEFDRQNRDVARSITYLNKTLCPLLVPDGQSFQHFVDGVLPKLVQLRTEMPWLAAAVDQFVLYRPRDATVYQLLERVGIRRERLMLVSPASTMTQDVEARRLVDTCVTPSLHPRTWRQARNLLQADQQQRQPRSVCDLYQPTGRRQCLLDKSERINLIENTKHQQQHAGLREQDGSEHHSNSSTLANSSLVILLSRRWTRNRGRRLLNEDEVFQYLVGRFGPRRVARFGHGRVDLTTAGRLFSRAAAVVGVHGGAFYNIILAPPGCVVVELMPVLVTASDGLVVSPRQRLAHTIVWRMADALDHQYWRLYANTQSRRLDVVLSTDKLRPALIYVL